MRFPGYSGLITALVLMQGCGSSEPPPAPRPSVLPELRASGQALASAETARDLEAVMRLWTSDAVVHAEGTEALTGEAAIRRMFRESFPTLRSVQAEPSRLDTSASGDMAFETGTLFQKVVGTAGPRDVATKYLMVWKRGSDGQWRVAALSLTGSGR